MRSPPDAEEPPSAARRQQLTDDVPVSLGRTPQSQPASSSTSAVRDGFACEVNLCTDDKMPPHLVTIHLVGKARSKEIAYHELNPAQQALARDGMKLEWDTWCQFNATSTLSQADLDNIMAATPRPRIIDTRWVLGWRGDRIKARLVVI